MHFAAGPRVSPDLDTVIEELGVDAGMEYYDHVMDRPAVTDRFPPYKPFAGRPTTGSHVRTWPMGSWATNFE